MLQAVSTGAVEQIAAAAAEGVPSGVLLARELKGAVSALMGTCAGSSSRPHTLVVQGRMR
jgi:hypothetical protein